MVQSSITCRVNRIRVAVPTGPLSIEIAMRPAWLRCAAFVGNSIWEVAVAALMIVVAPLAIVSLATAFVIACFKMQWNDAGSVANDQIRAAAPRLSFDLVAARSDRSPLAPHLWN